MKKFLFTFFIIQLLFLIPTSHVYAAILWSDSFKGESGLSLPQYNSAYYLPFGYATTNNSNFIIDGNSGIKISPSARTSYGIGAIPASSINNAPQYCEKFVFIHGTDNNPLVSAVMNSANGWFSQGYFIDWNFDWAKSTVTSHVYVIPHPGLIAIQSYNFDNSMSTHTLEACHFVGGLITEFFDGNLVLSVNDSTWGNGAPWFSMNNPRPYGRGF